MAKAVNFNTIKKHYWNVTLPDDKNTTLMIMSPTKAILEDIMYLQSNVNTISEDEANIEAVDDLYEACAKAMSRNKGGKKITKEYLSENFDFEDIKVFFSNYMNFVAEVTSEKN